MTLEEIVRTSNEGTLKALLNEECKTVIELQNQLAALMKSKPQATTAAKIGGVIGTMLGLMTKWLAQGFFITAGAIFAICYFGVPWK